MDGWFCLVRHSVASDDGNKFRAKIFYLAMLSANFLKAKISKQISQFVTLTLSILALGLFWHSVFFDLQYHLALSICWHSVSLALSLFGTQSPKHSVFWQSVFWHSVSLALSRNIDDTKYQLTNLEQPISFVIFFSISYMSSLSNLIWLCWLKENLVEIILLLLMID